MSRVSRRIAAVAAVVCVVVGVVSVASAAPQPGKSCKVAGRERVTSAGTLRCVASSGRSLRWVLVAAPVTTTTTTTTTSSTTTTVAASARAPQVSAISADDSRVRFTLSGMSPDTGNYAVQWVNKGQSFNTYRMLRATDKNVSISTAEFACGGSTYTFRVFVMRADWQLADGHQRQNVTPHSEPFDVAFTHACPAPETTTTAPVTTTTTVPLTCAQGGTCAVGDTGPGGGKVFYVHSSGTFSCGRALTSTCRYLEAATSDQSAAVVWATNVAACYADASDTGNLDCRDYSVYSDSAGQTASRTASRAIGAGLSNTVQIHSRLTAVGGAAVSSYAAGIAYAYSAGGLSDWYLPSVDELRQLFLQRLTVGGFAADSYWASSEDSRYIASRIDFVFGTPDTGFKSPLAIRVRPIRAFGGTLACADGGTCAVGDTGPGGGTVFYVASSSFTSTGSDCDTACRYLEAAPAPGGGDVARSWATNVNSNQTTAVPAPGATGTGIGSGMANTNAIQAQTGNVAATSAAVYAYDYSNGGKTDWHLPSKDELNELCKYAKNQAPGTTATLCAGTGVLRAGFSETDYWSSTETTNNSASGQAFYNVPGATQYLGMKNLDVSVRPVRAFG